MKEDSWKGQPCTLIAGGPSLKSFNWDLLRNTPNIIAVNRAYKAVPWASVCYVEDARFIERFGSDMVDFKGVKLWHVAYGTPKQLIAEALERDPNLTAIIETRRDKYWSKGFQKGLSTSSNAMVGALNVADLLGADPIYVMGLDCRTQGLEMQNWHTDYPQDWGVGAMQALTFKTDIELWVAPNLEHRHVVNLINPEFESALTCWPKNLLEIHFHD